MNRLVMIAAVTAAVRRTRSLALRTPVSTAATDTYSNVQMPSDAMMPMGRSR